ncbi:MAG: beta-1,6-N-acetylglucosaminyltransferase [Oscillospiraceae bacterium]|nr:beta-1,6-N-acetylglucosaminyltransferase [Oscillospiraceae bacterium]
MQAICILAHKDFEQVIELGELLRPVFEIYIHFDTKMKLSEMQKSYLIDNNIHFLQIVNVNWGAWGVGEAAYLLMKEALKKPSISYIHIISGQDYPVKPINQIYQFYENSNMIYMKSVRADGIKKSGEPIINWQKYYFDYDKINRRTTYGKIYHRLSMLRQTIMRVDKFKKLSYNGNIFHGANWMDLPRDAAEYLLKTFDESVVYQKIFKTGFCSDEFWAQTILSNSEMNDRIVQNHHRYIKWEAQHNSYPAILDENDFDYFANKEYQFIRKVDSTISKKLKKLIQENLL